MSADERSAHPQTLSRSRAAQPRLSRRRVVAGAAWTAPAIVLSSALPAVASSVPEVRPNISLVFVPPSPMTTNSQTTLFVLVIDADGNPTQGQQVSLTLPAGFSHSAGGGLTQTYTAQAGGLVSALVNSGLSPASGTVTARWITDPSVSATATLEARTTNQQSPGTITILGMSERSTDGPDEFRCDFTILVNRGVRPKKIEYNYFPKKPDYWLEMKPIADSQQSIGQAYSIAQVQDLGDGRELLWCAGRGDLDIDCTTVTKTYTNGIRASWPDGSSTVGRYQIEDVHRGNPNGRPVAIQAWDHTTAGLAGYIGPNSQTGWGNVVAPGTNGRLDGRKFHVDACNSGRAARTGNDITDSLYYQFVRGDNGQPASITPNPVPIAIPNNGGGVRGVLLSSLGSFELDAPGYYRLVVWPQSRSSRADATQSSVGVAYDPSDLGQATTVGSVFWKIPATA